MSDSLRKAHQRKITQEAAKLKAALKKKIGDECPEGFFEEIDEFIEYVYSRDSLEDKVEQMEREVRSERMKVHIIGIAISVTFPLVGFILFAL